MSEYRLYDGANDETLNLTKQEVIAKANDLADTVGDESIDNLDSALEYLEQYNITVQEFEFTEAKQVKAEESPSVDIGGFNNPL